MTKHSRNLFVFLMWRIFLGKSTHLALIKSEICSMPWRTMNKMLWKTYRNKLFIFFKKNLERKKIANKRNASLHIRASQPGQGLINLARPAWQTIVAQHPAAQLLLQFVTSHILLSCVYVTVLHCSVVNQASDFAYLLRQQQESRVDGFLNSNLALCFLKATS